MNFFKIACHSEEPPGDEESRKSVLMLLTTGFFGPLGLRMTLGTWQRACPGVGQALYVRQLNSSGNKYLLGLVAQPLSYLTVIYRVSPPLTSFT